MVVTVRESQVTSGDGVAHLLESQLIWALHEVGRVTVDGPTDGEWFTWEMVSVVVVESGPVRVGLRGVGDSVVVGDGGAYLVWPGRAHRLALEAGVQARLRFAHLHRPALLTAERAPMEPVRVTLSTTRLGPLLDELEAAQSLACPIRRTLALQATMPRIVDELIADGAVAVHAERIDGRLLSLRPVLDHIERTLAAAHSREELAALVHLSPTRFGAVFRERMGLSPMAYLNQRRIHHAKRLLLGSERSVAEIAALVSPFDANRFGKVFRQACACSPGAYRKALRGAVYARQEPKDP